MATNNNVNTSLSGQTGTGSFVGSNSPTLVTPVLGTPSSGNGTNLTNTGGLKSFQIFTSGTAATYTKPANVTSILVEMIGGGGGGGGVASTATGGAGGGGGGGGGYLRKYIASAAGTYTYTVGPGGAGGTTGNNAGSAGTASTWSGGSLSAGGGAGGSGSANFTVSTFTGLPVAGGTSTNGDINVVGGQGNPGFYSTTQAIALGGVGGIATYLSNGTQQPAINGGITNGFSGTGYGGGGSGGAGQGSASTAAGGTGATGIIIVWEFA
jgi:hypothetical protein